MSYQLITSPDQLLKACLILRALAFIGLDTETTALDPYKGRLRLIQLASPSQTFILDLHQFPVAGGNPPAIDPLRELLSSARPMKILHNAKFDLKWINHHLHVEVGGLFDTMLSAQLLDFSARHSLDATLEQYLHIEVDKSLQTSDWSGELSHAQYGYAARDAELLLPLHSELTKLLHREGLERVARLEFEVAPQIAGLELAGIYVDREKFEALITSIEARRDQIGVQLLAKLEPGVPQMSLFSEISSGINLDSPSQLTEAFSRIGILLPPSTRAHHLLPLAEEHEAVQLLLDYREMSKLASSFGRNLLKIINPATGRLHAHFRQIGTPTGRIICERPNLQQLPKEGEVRGVFRAPPGRLLITADYSTIELRILAEVTGDERLREVFLKGRDPHRETAARIFGCAPEDVTPQMRAVGKGLNYGVAYGIGARRFARVSGRTEEEARLLMGRYFAAHPRLDEWMRGTVREALETGSVRTISGRVIRFDFDPADREAVANVSLAARNAPAQGTSADILKRALVLLGQRLPALKSQVVNVIHDEVVVEAPAESAEEVAKVVAGAMREAGEEYLPDVPVEVEPVVGTAWQKR